MSKMKVHPAISMKIKSRRQIADPKLSTFGHDVPNCSAISCKPPRILQESGAIMSRTERGRVRSSFQSAGSQAPDFACCGNRTNSCHRPPPALTRRPSLTKEGSFSLNRGRELLTARNADGGHDICENKGTYRKFHRVGQNRILLVIRDLFGDTHSSAGEKGN